MMVVYHPKSTKESIHLITDVFSSFSLHCLLLCRRPQRRRRSLGLYRLFSVVIPSLHEREMFALSKSLQPMEDMTERICTGNEGLV